MQKAWRIAETLNSESSKQKCTDDELAPQGKSTWLYVLESVFDCEKAIQGVNMQKTCLFNPV